MTNINVALGRAEASLARAKEIFQDVKRTYTLTVPQERRDRARELRPTHGVDASACSQWTQQQLAMRRAAGLERDVPPVVTTLSNQQIHERCLAGLPVKPAASITARPYAFFPVVAQEAHARIEKLDQALLNASQAVDRKASVDVSGYPKLMSWEELWRAIEAERSSLRSAAP